MSLPYDHHSSLYSLYPKMNVHVPNFGEIKGPLTIDRVSVRMSFKIGNKKYSETLPEVAVSKDFLMMKGWRENI